MHVGREMETTEALTIYFELEPGQAHGLNVGAE